MNSKKISVITIVYNDAKHIERTLLSVINQSAFDSIEYIVVDGASTDGTSEIIKRYSNKISRYICEPDTGIYNAMNKGLATATGDYVQFINSGDGYSSSDVVERIIAEMGSRVPDVVYGHYRETKESSVIRSVIPCRNADKIWYGPVAAHQSMLYRVRYISLHGIRYDEALKIAADYKFSAEAIKHSDNILKTDICISDFDVSGVSSTNQNQGLREANLVRREVFGWGKYRITALTTVLLCSRLAKQYCNPIYKLLRH